MKNALASVEFRLNLPEARVEQILASRMLTPDDGSDAWYRSACDAIEAAIKDDLQTYLEYAADEPEVEVDA
jgi:predicted AlkP superfamily phosphohydrolase/phosphomutase